MQWPFKDMARGATIMIEGQPPEVVEKAVRSVKARTGSTFQTKRRLAPDGSVCVEVTRLTGGGDRGANQVWPFKDMYVGETVTIYGHPMARVNKAMHSYAATVGAKFRLRPQKLLNGTACVIVTRLMDDGWHPDPARDPEGPGPLFARNGHLPPSYCGPWPWERLKPGESDTYHERVYSQNFLRRAAAWGPRKGWHIERKVADASTGTFVTVTVTRVTA